MFKALPSGRIVSLIGKSGVGKSFLACSFADSRLWLGANGWRRAKKSCLGGQYRKVGANRKLFVCRKGWLLRIARQGLCKRKAFCVKRRFLSAVRKFFYKRISF